MYFTPHGMIYRCCTPDSTGHGVREAPEEHAASVRDWYRNFMSTYSGLHLTRPMNDRLIAVSGMSNEYLLKLAGRQTQQTDADTQMFMSCGHWRTGLITSLLWQLDVHATRDLERLPLYPSWSWASILGRVSWEGMEMGNDTALAEIQSIDMQGTVAHETLSADASTSQDVQGASRPRSSLAVNSLIQARSSRSIDEHVSLCVTGHSLPVSIRRMVESLEEAEVIANLSTSWTAGEVGDYVTGKTATRAKNWRTVCSSQESAEICGWASIEHADFQDDASFVSGPTIYALVVLQTPNRTFPFAHGNLWRSTKTYTVLYVRSLGGNSRFQRIGVGRLFGRMPNEAYKRSQPNKITLV